MVCLYNIYMQGGKFVKLLILLIAVTYRNILRFKGELFANFLKCIRSWKGPMTIANIPYYAAMLFLTRWWFQIFFIFTPIWGNDPF